MKKECQYILLPTKHLYILSDDEIKEGDWYYSAVLNEIFKCEDRINLIDVCKKIIATTNPELNKPSNKVVGNMSLNIMKNGIPKISQPDIEYIINLYNTNKEKKNKEIHIEELAENDLKKLNYRDEIETNRIKGGWIKGYDQCLQDNADKKFSLEDIRAIVRKSIYLKGGFDKEGFSFYKDDNEIMDECIQSLTKEQPKNDTLIVEYEYTAKCYIHRPIPKLKDNRIIIHKT